MKKGLLSILAGALLVVGCQNYDDQFSSLESQINALASTVAGLSQVQSDLASLSGTVSSLSSTVASLGSSIDTAVSSGLADITEDIAALQAALADVASSSDLAAISAAVAANQADLDELLANSSVYQGPVNISGVSTLETYYAMGSTLAIVNGSVDIDATADMDNTKLQAVIDQIKVTTGSFDYQAASSAVSPVSFDNLTGTQTLTVKQAGDYSFKKLASATNIFLYNTWKQSVDKIDFRELTSVTKFYTNGGTENTIDFDKATELHLTKLAFYAPLNLTIVTKKGAAMPFILDDKDIDGDQADITLNITGPSPLTISNITDGTLTFANVAELTVNGFEGKLDINAGVESFTADKVTSATLSTWLAGATDLETLDITGALDPDDTDDLTGPVVTITSNSNLETVKIAGKTGAISLNGNSDLTSVTISADVNGAINIGNSTGNGALSSVTLTGSKATAVNVSKNEDLTSLTIDTTFRAADDDTDIDGDIDVVDNASLASLTITSTAVENLTVTGNDALTKVDFSKIATDGTTGTPDVDIWDNDLTATFNDSADSASDDTDAGEANDLGKVSGSSGIETIATYLAHIDGATGANIQIAVDTVNFTTEANATNEYTWATGTTAAAKFSSSGLNQNFIAYITPNTASTGAGAVAAKRSYLLTGFGDAGDNVTVYANGSTLVSTAAASSGNQGQIIDAIVNTASLAAADTAGVELSATPYAQPKVYLTIAPNSSSMENSASTVSGTAFGRHVSDSFTIALPGANTITVSNTTESGDETTLAVALYNAWVVKNVSNSATWSRWDISSDTSGKRLIFTAKDSGTSQIGTRLTFTASIASASLSNVGYKIGNPINDTTSTADNIARGNGGSTGAIVVSLLADTKGPDLSEIGKPWVNNLTTSLGNASITTSGVIVKELSTTLNRSLSVSGVITTENQFPYDSRSDVVTPQNTLNAATSNANTFNRVNWLG